MREKIEILYEDEDIIVVYKPAKIATQTGKIGERDVETAGDLSSRLYV